MKDKLLPLLCACFFISGNGLAREPKSAFLPIGEVTANGNRIYINGKDVAELRYLSEKSFAVENDVDKIIRGIALYYFDEKKEK